MTEILRTVPRKYQRIGIKFILKNKKVLLGDDMGLGKTMQALGSVAIVPEFRPVVIVCPSSVKYHWADELWQHARIKSYVLSGTRTGTFDWGKGHRHKTDGVFILNYEILQYWEPILAELGIQFLIGDEIHRIKTMTAGCTKSFRRLGMGVPYVVGLSGTPVENRPIELYSFLSLVAPHITINKREFGVRYCAGKKKSIGRGRKVWDYSGASNIQELHSRLKNVMLRRRKSEVLKELPPKVRTFLSLDIDLAQYRKKEEDFKAWIHEKSSTGSLKAVRAAALSKLSYLRKVAAELKLKQCQDWIDDYLRESGKKLVVFSWHRSVAKKLKEIYGDSAVLYTGQVSLKNKEKAKLRFIKNPKVRLFISNIKAGGTGVNGLQHVADTSFFIEFDWSPKRMEQAEDRVHRIGQKSTSIMAVYAVARDTLEEKLLQLVEKKRQVIDALIDGNSSGASDFVLRFLEDLK